MGRKKKTKQEISLRLPSTLENDVVAFSSDFMYKYTHEQCFQEWGILHRKLFAMVLDAIDWKGTNSNVIELKNKDISKKLGWNFSDKEMRNAGIFMQNAFTHMVGHSMVCLYNPDLNHWFSENLIMGADGNSVYTNVTLNPHFMPHFEKLYEYASAQGQGFYTLLLPDITIDGSEYGNKLFMRLRSYHKKDACATYSHVFSTKELKDLLGMKKGDYMRKHIEGTDIYKDFNRTGFEREVLTKALNDVNKSEMIRILRSESGELFEKIKEGKSVKGYKIVWRVYPLDIIANMRDKKFNEETKRIIEQNSVDLEEDIIDITDDCDGYFE